MQEPENDHIHLGLADEINDMMPESSGSGSGIKPDGNDTELKNWHIIIIAVAVFIALCFLLACLVSSHSS